MRAEEVLQSYNTKGVPSAQTMYQLVFDSTGDEEAAKTAMFRQHALLSKLKGTSE